MNSPSERRLQPRTAIHSRGVVIADGLERPCMIVDASDGGLRLRLERPTGLPRSVVIVDLGRALAFEATVAWQKGIEAGVKLGQGTSVRGLVPSRFLPAREAWIRAGSR